MAAPTLFPNAPLSTLRPSTQGPHKPSSYSFFLSRRLKPSCSQLKASFCRSRIAFSCRAFNQGNGVPKPEKILRTEPPSTTGATTKEKSRIPHLSLMSAELLVQRASGLTPLEVCKWVGFLSLAVAAAKSVLRLATDPFFLMYFSWTWLFWPWMVAFSLGALGLYFAYKHSAGKASVWEQLVVVSSAFTWLTLVPPAVANGFLEGWPVAFFFIYHYFFFFNVSVRKRLYGDYYLRPHDEKWDVRLPLPYRVAFAAAVLVSHFLAAFEAPPLHQVPGGWQNLPIWLLVMVVLLMQYNSVLHLSNYSEKVVVPTSVVQFGPFRWIRHPIYASTLFLFAVYFAALRAPLSMLFIQFVGVLYYDQKAKLEEDLMLKSFGDSYETYRNKVRYKFIPYVY
ncbi:hypothetical protein EJ110_NYTH29833 [Nymphaea thermarum]|nr:hypothetical protein EJ110_NYTH29833 [Nymphaea thermarum]